MFSFLKKTPATAESTNWLSRLTGSLARTGGQLSALLVPGGRIDEDLYEELETILITSDVGMDATHALIADVRRQVKEQRMFLDSWLDSASSLSFSGGQLRILFPRKFSIQRELPPIADGDILVIHDTGPHGHAMGFNYNGKLRPQELLLRRDGSVELILRAETVEDHFATLTFKPVGSLAPFFK